MDACAVIGKEAGWEVVEATVGDRSHASDGLLGPTFLTVRVTPATAFRADWPEPREGDVWVECAVGHWVPAIIDGRSSTVTNAAEDGATFICADPSAPPAEFLPASAVGRLATLLFNGTWHYEREWGWWLSRNDLQLPTPEAATDPILFAAASSHWQQAALDGLCPGVEPSAFKAWLGGLDAS
jgi:hypothetical protein